MNPFKIKFSFLFAIVALWFGSPAAQAQRSSTGGGGGSSSSYRSGGSSAPSSSSAANNANATVDYPNNTLPGSATFSYDPETKSLIVLTDDKTFDNISTVVSNLDRPKPQVLIKVVFLEVQHDDALDFGVEGSYNQNPSTTVLSALVTNTVTGTVTQVFSQNPATGNSFGNNFGLAGLGANGQTIGQTTMPPGAGIYSVLGSDYQATVRAIASSQKVEVLSRPSILVRNNQPATITVGQSVPLVTGVTYPSLTGGPVSTITYQNIGIILQVTPFISEDGLVEMIVAPQISSLSSQTVQIATNLSVPVIDIRSASTVVVTPDGQTVIIGGLMETDKTKIDSKIPLLGDIPLLGYLFKHTQNANTKKELLIFLTPHVVNMPSQLAALAEKDSKNSELSHKAFTEQELDKFFDRLPVKPHTVWENQPPGK